MKKTKNPFETFNVIALVVTTLVQQSYAADGTWTGAAAATWNTTNTNWSGVVAGTPWDVTNGASNRAVFSTAGATPSVSGTVYSNGLGISQTVTIAGGTALNLVGTTPTIDASANATISTVVAGSAGLAKTGAGTLTLSGTNTYTGVTSITGGVISTALLAAGGSNSGIGAAATGAANLVIDGGTLKYTGPANNSPGWSRGFTIGVSGASFDLSSATGQLLIGGSLANTGSGARTLTVTTNSTAGGRLAFNIVNGSGGATSVVKKGAGTLIISAGANTYTGLLDIQAGSAQFGNGGSGGESTGSGHSVTIASGATLTFRHDSANITTFNAPISGAGKVNFNYNNSGTGGGSLTLGGNNTFSGGLTISPSSGALVLPLKVGSATALGTGNVTIGQYGKLDLNGFNSSTGLLISTGTNGIVTNDGSSDANLTLAGSGTQAFGGVIQDGTSKVSIVKTGAGTQSLTGVNTYSGSTTVQAGTLSISNNNTLSDASAVNLSTGSVLNLTFSGTDNVGALTINGVFQAPGEYGALSSGAANETALITGSGRINNLNANEALPHYWDTTGTSWSVGASWTYDAANPASDTPAGPATNSVPIFGADGIADDTVELGGNQTAAGLSFISPVVFTLTGGGVSSDLSLGVSGISLDADAGNVVIGSLTANQDVDVVLSASQTWSNANAAADLGTLNAVSAGSNALTLAGAGTFTFGGSVTGTGALSLAAAGNSTFGSSVNDFSSISITGSGNTAFNGAVTGTTSISKRGAGGLTLAGTNTHSGGITLDQGTMTISGNSSAATGSILLRGAGASGTLFNQSVTTATFGSSSSVSVAGGNSIQVGPLSFDGTAAQTLNANGTVTNAGSLIIGRAGTVNVAGSWTQTGSARLQTFGGYIPILKIATGGIFTHAASSNFLLGSSALSTGTITPLKIEGGTFVTGFPIHNDQTAVLTGTSSQVALSNGGTLRLSANITDLFTTAGANRSFLLGAGGGTVDTNGFSTTLNVPVSGTGSISKAGAGTLTLAETNTYSGNTTVNAGTLSLGQVNASNESSTVSIASGAALNLTFVGTDTVDKLFLGGVQQAAGVYGSANSGGLITGSGTLTVSTGPASGFTSWIAGFGLALADQDPTDDPDNDGLNNLLEFALNGNPAVANPSILPTLNVTASAFEFTYQRRDDSISPETTQTFEWGTTLATWSGSAVIPATSGTVGVATITVTDASPADTVKVSIPKSEAGAAGNLFGRLKVVKP